MIRTLFNDDWKFTLEKNSEEDALGLIPQSAEPVSLPHDWSIKTPRSPDAAGGADSGYFVGGYGCYYKYLTMDAKQRNNTVMLEFEGVMQIADIYVNGSLILTHPNGYTNFIVDITKYLNPDGRNLIKVGVTNPERNSRWYTGSGIYRNVYLLTAGALSFPPYALKIITPEAFTDRSKVLVTAEVQNKTTTLRQLVLRTTLYNPKGRRIAAKKKKLKIKAGSSTQSVVPINLKKAQLWSPDSPFVYKTVCEIYSEDKPDVVIDKIESTFGIRSLEFVAGEGFLLNGSPINLKGGNVRPDNGILGAAAYQQAEERKVRLLKDAGFNAVKTAHFTPSTDFLNACDQYGLMVIEEAFDVWESPKRPMDYHIYFGSNWHLDIESMIKKDRNHPSVIMWSIGNDVGERDGSGDCIEIVNKLCDLVRYFDNTRAVTAFSGAVTPRHDELEKLLADKSFMQDIEHSTVQKIRNYSEQTNLFGKATASYFKPLDVCGYNYLHQRYEMDAASFPERLIFGSETATATAFESWEKTENLPSVIGDFVWTAIDYLGKGVEGESLFPNRCAGIGDMDITGRRRPQSFYRSVIWGDKATSLIVVHDPEDAQSKSPLYGANVHNMWSFPRFVGKPVKVDVYTAGEVVALYLDDKLIGRKLAGRINKFIAQFEMKYYPGTLTAVCFSKGVEVSRCVLKTPSSPRAIKMLTEKKTMFNTSGRLVYVDIFVADKDGEVVPFADREISLELNGTAAELIALGNGAVASYDSFFTPKQKVFEGRLQAILRLNGSAGKVSITALCDGLKKAKLALNIKDYDLWLQEQEQKKLQRQQKAAAKKV